MSLLFQQQTDAATSEPGLRSHRMSRDTRAQFENRLTWSLVELVRLHRVLRFRSMVKKTCSGVCSNTNLHNITTNQLLAARHLFWCGN